MTVAVASPRQQQCSRLRRNIGTLALLLGGIALAPQALAQARTLGALKFKPCALASAFSAEAIEAYCTQLHVAENPALPNGRKIALKIAWLPARREDAAEDPVFLLAGGPGQSALESYPAVAPAFADVRKRRHVILVDQRGTGGSGKLVCRDRDGDSAVMEPDQAQTLAAARAFAESCRAQLSRTADLRYYTTTDAVRDLDSVRRALGVEQINLLGVSYGTRVAQQYAMRHPASTRTIVLDSVVPNSLVLGGEHARNLEASLDLQFARCARLPSCKQKLGNPRANLATLMARLRADPPLVTYRDGMSGERRQERLTPAHVAGLTRMFAYAPAAAAVLPLLLAEAVRGDYPSLMALSDMVTRQVGDQIMHGMQLSVICSEDDAELRSDPADADSLLGNVMVEFSRAQCAVWPKGVRPANFRAPLATNVPALLLSGEFDPVTPPKYGDAVAKHLPNGRHLLLRGQGHSVVGTGCLPKVFARFIETTDAKALDVKCLAKLPYTPPFTGFYGWEP